MKYKVFVKLESEYYNIEAESPEEAFIIASDYAMDGGDWQYDVTPQEEAVIQMTNNEAIEYGKEQLKIFGGQHAEFIRMAIEALSAQPDIIQCKDCYWWEKQESSLQGRCDRYGFYPTGYWYCAGARERKENE